MLDTSSTHHDAANDKCKPKLGILTESQRDFIYDIWLFIIDNGYFPSFKQIMNRHSFKSKQAVTEYFNKLEQHELIFNAGGGRYLTAKGIRYCYLHEH